VFWSFVFHDQYCYLNQEVRTTMADQISIYRKLGESDFDDVAALYDELQDDSSIIVERENFERILQHPGSAIYGAAFNGRIIAMATLHLLPNLAKSRPSYCLVENVVTLRVFQGQGFGRGVMNVVIEAAWAAGAYKIMLLTGVDAGARGFYEKCGFSGVSKVGMQIRRVPTRKVRKR
jgi:GNAT superfamily N-acetyltransferase